MTKKRASIRDVAKAAGVSHATVSLILNGKMAGTEETRERVLAAVRDLGYRPDANFRKAVTERMRVNGGGAPEKRVSTKTLALFLPEKVLRATQANDGYYSGVFAGACQGAAEEGWNILLCPQAEEMQTIPEVVLDQRVEGAMFESVLFRKEWIATIGAQLPIAMINFIEPGIDALTVTPQWEKAGYQLIDYAVGKGHTNFAFFQHDTESVNLSHVNRGQETALRAHGLELIHPGLSRPRPVREDNTERCIGAFLDEWEKAQPRPTVILSTEYYISLVAAALAKRGYSVPQDVSLIGRGAPFRFDTPRFTSYVYPVHQIGYSATKSLIQSIRSGHYQATHVMLPGELVEGGTVADLRA